MLNLEWSYDAIEDLKMIWDNIAQDDVDAADTFVEKLREEARRACMAPKTGRIIPEFENEAYRERFYKGYTIIYEIREECIIVHEVYNQRRIFIRAYRR